MIPHILIDKGPLERQKVDFIALPIATGMFEADPQLEKIDQAVGGELKLLAQQAEFVGRTDQVLECTTLGRLAQQRILLVGIGADGTHEESRFRNYAAVAVRHASNSGAHRVALALPSQHAVEHLRAIAEGVMLGAYRFTEIFNIRAASQAPCRFRCSLRHLEGNGQRQASHRTGTKRGSSCGANPRCCQRTVKYHDAGCVCAVRYGCCTPPRISRKGSRRARHRQDWYVVTCCGGTG